MVDTETQKLIDEYLKKGGKITVLPPYEGPQKRHSRPYFENLKHKKRENLEPARSSGLQLKHAYLTDKDYSYIKWRIWEPLRRNKHYRRLCELILEKGNFHSPRFKSIGYKPSYKQRESFQRKRGLPHPIHPDLTFEDLMSPAPYETKMQARRKVAGLFSELYPPKDGTFDAIDVIVPHGEEEKWILEGKYLPVFINLKRGYNQIVSETERVLNEWQNKRSNYYGIEPIRGSNYVHSFRRISRDDIDGFHYLRCHIDIRISKTNIIKRLREIITEHRQHGEDNLNPSRMHEKKWEACFYTYDRYECFGKNGYDDVKKRVENPTFKGIANALGISESTIKDRYQRALDAIYYNASYTVPPPRKPLIPEEVTEICRNCQAAEPWKFNKCVNQHKETGELLCPEVEAYYRQEEGQKYLGSMVSYSTPYQLERTRIDRLDSQEKYKTIYRDQKWDAISIIRELRQPVNDQNWPTIRKELKRKYYAEYRLRKCKALMDHMLDILWQGGNDIEESDKDLSVSRNPVIQKRIEYLSRLAEGHLAPSKRCVGNRFLKKRFPEKDWGHGLRDGCCAICEGPTTN
jgi:hypothetical protein